jgi:hypothetical protein
LTKQQIQSALLRKFEALEFWEGLRNAMPVESKIALLRAEIEESKIKLKEVNDGK